MRTYAYPQSYRWSGYIRENRSVIASEFTTGYYAEVGADSWSLLFIQPGTLNKTPSLSVTS